MMMNSLYQLSLIAERHLSSPDDRLDSAEFLKESIDHKNDFFDYESLLGSIQPSPSCWLPYPDHSYAKHPPTATVPTSNILNIDDVGVGGNATVFTTTSLDAAAESWEGSVTRCICEFQHDDGYMICCDRCGVWQHVDCMGVDRLKIPDVYLCELCEPRYVDKHHAIRCQAKKREVLMTQKLDTSGTDTEDDMSHGPKKLPTKRKRTRRFSVSNTVSNKTQKPLMREERKKSAPIVNRSPVRNYNMGRQRRIPKSPELVSPPPQKHHTVKSTLESKSTVPSYFQPARQQNLYTPELMQCLEACKLALSTSGPNPLSLVQHRSTTDHCKPLVSATMLQISADIKAQGLEATQNIAAGQPVVEFTGNVMLRSQYQTFGSFSFVLFYSKIGAGLEVCIDASHHDNDAKYIRRSCKPNAEIRHFFDQDGGLRFCIWSTLDISSGAEVTIPLEFEPQKGIAKNKSFTVVSEKEPPALNVVQDEPSPTISPVAKRRRRSTLCSSEEFPKSPVPESSPTPVNNQLQHVDMEVNEPELPSPKRMRRHSQNERPQQHTSPDQQANIDNPKQLAAENSKRQTGTKYSKQPSGHVSPETVEFPAPPEQPKPKLQSDLTKQQTPAKLVQTPAKLVQTPAKLVQMPAKLVQTPAKLAQTSAKPAQTPAKPTQTPAKPTQTPAKPTQTPAKLTQTPAKPMEDTKCQVQPANVKRQMSLEIAKLVDTPAIERSQSTDSKDKKMSREEKKMEAIMKAFERIEKLGGKRSKEPMPEKIKKRGSGTKQEMKEASEGKNKSAKEKSKFDTKLKKKGLKSLDNREIGKGRGCSRKASVVKSESEDSSSEDKIDVVQVEEERKAIKEESENNLCLNARDEKSEDNDKKISVKDEDLENGDVSVDDEDTKQPGDKEDVGGKIKKEDCSERKQGQVETDVGDVPEIKPRGRPPKSKVVDSKSGNVEVDCDRVVKTKDRMKLQDKAASEVEDRMKTRRSVKQTDDSDDQDSMESEEERKNKSKIICKQVKVESKKKNKKMKVFKKTVSKKVPCRRSVRLVTETTAEKSDKSSSPERPVKNISKKVAKKVESKIKKVEFTTGDEDTVVVTGEKPTLLDSYKSKVKRISERKLSQSNEILDSANSESEVDGVENRLESSPYPSRSSSFHSGQIMMSTSATQLDASQGQGFAKKRWLRQAINESSDTSPVSVSTSHTTSNELLNSGSTGGLDSTSPMAAGFVTPLKKRRLTVDSQGENNLSQYPTAQKFEWTETGGFHPPSPPMPERQIEVGLAHPKNSAKDNLPEQSTAPVNNAGGLQDALVIAHPIGVEYEHNKSTIGGPVAEVCLNMRTDAVQNIKNYELDSRGRVNDVTKDVTKETYVLDRERKPSQTEVKEVSSLVAGNRQLETSPPFDRELAYNKKLDETSVTEPTSNFSNDGCKLKQNPANPSPCDFEVSTTDLTLGSSELDSAFGKRRKTHSESEAPGDPTVTCSSATDENDQAVCAAAFEKEEGEITDDELDDPSSAVESNEKISSSLGHDAITSQQNRHSRKWSWKDDSRKSSRKETSPDSRKTAEDSLVESTSVSVTSDRQRTKEKQGSRKSTSYNEDCSEASPSPERPGEKSFGKMTQADSMSRDEVDEEIVDKGLLKLSPESSVLELEEDRAVQSSQQGVKKKMSLMEYRKMRRNSEKMDLAPKLPAPPPPVASLKPFVIQEMTAKPIVKPTIVRETKRHEVTPIKAPSTGLSAKKPAEAKWSFAATAAERVLDAKPLSLTDRLRFEFGLDASDGNDRESEEDDVPPPPPPLPPPSNANSERLVIRPPPLPPTTPDVSTHLIPLPPAPVSEEIQPSKQSHLNDHVVSPANWQPVQRFSFPQQPCGVPPPSDMALVRPRTLLTRPLTQNPSEQQHQQQRFQRDTYPNQQPLGQNMAMHGNSYPVPPQNRPGFVVNNVGCVPSPVPPPVQRFHGPVAGSVQTTSSTNNQVSYDNTAAQPCSNTTSSTSEVPTYYCAGDDGTWYDDKRSGGQASKIRRNSGGASKGIMPLMSISTGFPKKEYQGSGNYGSYQHAENAWVESCSEVSTTLPAADGDYRVVSSEQDFDVNSQSTDDSNCARKTYLRSSLERNRHCQELLRVQMSDSLHDTATGGEFNHGFPRN